MREPGDLMRYRTLGWRGPVEVSARIIIEVLTPREGLPTCLALSAAGGAQYGTFTYKQLSCPLIRARHVRP